MSRIPYSVNNYVGGAPVATLSGAITPTSTTVYISGTTASGWNHLGQTGGFALSLDYNTVNEEKIWVPSGSYAWGSPVVTLSNVERAYDGTGLLFTISGFSHNDGATVVHILTATDLQESNQLVSIYLGYQNPPVGFIQPVFSPVTSGFSAGIGSSVSGLYPIGFGNGTTVSGTNSLAIGINTGAIGDYITSLGANAGSSAGYSTNIGNYAGGTGPYSTSLGYNSTADGQGGLAIGYASQASGFDSAAIGSSSTALFTHDTAIGASASASGPSAIGIGNNAVASGYYSIAIGANTKVVTSGSVAIGTDTTGSGALATGQNQIVLGTVNHTVTAPGVISGTRVAKRVLLISGSSNGTPTYNTDNYDYLHITYQTAAITSFTSSGTGTPRDGDTFRISVASVVSGIPLTFGTNFEASTVALPTTTVSGVKLDIGFFWNTETSKWRIVAVA